MVVRDFVLKFKILITLDPETPTKDLAEKVEYDKPLSYEALSTIKLLFPIQNPLALSNACSASLVDSYLTKPNLFPVRLLLLLGRYTSLMKPKLEKNL